tara:strand:- start:82 stop:789 length:708 start_codon:yes stop_codon:yes gene_type:complete
MNIKAYYNALKVILINKINSYTYIGNNVICQMCGWKGRKFPKNICPKCRSFARTRLLAYCFSYFSFEKLDEILHVAPSIGEYIFIKNNIKYNRYNTLNLIKSSHIDIIDDLTNLSIDSNSYNLIIAWHVMEHIPDDDKAISEMYRILKPGGNILLCVPIFPKGNNKTFENKEIDYIDYERIHGHSDHCRSCGLDYFKRFESVGFSTETLFVKNLNKKDIDYYGLSISHLTWLFTK